MVPASLVPSRVICFGEVLLCYSKEAQVARAEVCTNGPAKEMEWKRSVTGAELNIAVALKWLGWPTPFFVSALPATQQGEETLGLLQEALGGPELAAGGLLLRRSPGRVGTVHIAGPTNVYERESVFSRLDKTWFSEAFWRDFFACVAKGEPRTDVTFLQLSGIPLLLSQEAASAWQRALRGAEHARAQGVPLVVVLELAPGQEFNGYLELWMMIRPYLGTPDILLLSISSLTPLYKLLGRPEVEVSRELLQLDTALVGSDFIHMQKLPEELRSIDSIDAILADALLQLHRILRGRDRQQFPTLLLTVKVGDSRRSILQLRSHAQRRWSLACSGTKVSSTVQTALHHQPLTCEGGTDAWLAGVIDALATSEVTKPLRPYRLAVGESRWEAVLRRGDQLAALKQDRCMLSSDFSTVTREELNGGALLSDPKGDFGDEEGEGDSNGPGSCPKRRRREIEKELLL